MPPVSLTTSTVKVKLYSNPPALGRIGDGELSALHPLVPTVFALNISSRLQQVKLNLRGR